MSVRMPVGVCAGHAVEFSRGDSNLENVSGAALRQHSRAEASRGYSAYGRQADRNLERSRRAAGRCRSGAWARRGGRRCSSAPCQCSACIVYRLGGGGARNRFGLVGRISKRVSLESAANAQVVMEDGDLDLAVEGALWGAFGTTGQRCTATSRFIVHRQVAKKFTDMLVERARTLKIGNGLDESIDMGPLINPAAREKVLGYIDIGKREGRALAHRRFGLRKGFMREWLFLRADDLRSGKVQHAHRPRRNLSARCYRSSKSTASRKPSKC